MQEKTLLDDPNFRKFYVTAKRSTYAAGGDQKAEILKNGGKRYVFWDRRWPQWRYIDVYHGYNPFFGNETVEEIPLISPVVWTPIAQMSYGGYARGTEDEIKRIFVFLEEMLRQVSVRSLFRGPIGDTIEDGLHYHCFWIKRGPFRIDGTEYIRMYPPLSSSLPFPYGLDFQFFCLR